MDKKVIMYKQAFNNICPICKTASIELYSENNKPLGYKWITLNYNDINKSKAINAKYFKCLNCGRVFKKFIINGKVYPLVSDEFINIFLKQFGNGLKDL